MANSYYQRKATIDAVNAQKPAALRRDGDTDYTSGYFFVTLSIRDHKPLLGTMKGEIDPVTHRVINACVKQSVIGERVQACWQSIPLYHPNVQVIDHIVMPEHFHGLLYLDHVDGVTLSMVIKGFKIGCNRAYREIMSSETGTIFARGYNETIPITEEEIATKTIYIHENPIRRIIKESMPNRFTIYRSQHSINWNEDRIRHGLQWDRTLHNHPDQLELAYQELLPNLSTATNDTSILTLSYIGSRDLLHSPQKFPLVCHRADEPLRNRQIEAVLREAQSGAVIVSAFISPKERELRDQLLQQGCSIIEILDNGISSTHKPWGKAFYHCAEGHLLQITPWTYRYQKGATVSRPMCMVMNELARLISGHEDDWWK